MLESSQVQSFLFKFQENPSFSLLKKKCITGSQSKVVFVI